MKLSIKQKGALEKETGQPWDSWHPNAIEAFFMFTDKGQRMPLLDRVWKVQLPNFQFSEAEQALWDLMQYHWFHSFMVELWKKDFLKGLLFIDDFLDEPDERLKHALEIYRDVMSYIPSKYATLCKKLGVKRKEIYEWG